MIGRAIYRTVLYTGILSLGFSLGYCSGRDISEKKCQKVGSGHTTYSGLKNRLESETKRSSSSGVNNSDSKLEELFK